MVKNDVITAITHWTSWASIEGNDRYDIALLKVWIQFEKFLGELFVLYALGNPSELGYVPTLKLKFQTEEQLNVFLREGNRTYIDYITQTKKFSKHIFVDDPFSKVIFEDSDNNGYYNEIIAIRNFVAHESGESRTKYLKVCFGNNDSNYKEPNEYLKSRRRSGSETNYTRYINAIKAMTELLVQPPD